MTLLFGTLFSGKPKLSIADERSSQILPMATEVDSLIVKQYGSAGTLKQAVAAGKVFPTYYMIQPVIEITQQGGTWSDVAAEVFILIGLILTLLLGVAIVARKTRQYAV
ncbi:MAG: hypothetical protein ACE5LU_03035 [Anaerolineae bacterium]